MLELCLHNEFHISGSTDQLSIIQNRMLKMYIFLGRFFCYIIYRKVEVTRTIKLYFDNIVLLKFKPPAFMAPLSPNISEAMIVFVVLENSGEVVWLYDGWFRRQ